MEVICNQREGLIHHFLTDAVLGFGTDHTGTDRPLNLSTCRPLPVNAFNSKGTPILARSGLRNPPDCAFVGFITTCPPE